MIKLLDLLKEILDGTNQAPYGLMFFGDNKALAKMDSQCFIASLNLIVI